MYIAGHRNCVAAAVVVVAVVVVVVVIVAEIVVVGVAGSDIGVADVVIGVAVAVSASAGIGAISLPCTYGSVATQSESWPPYRVAPPPCWHLFRSRRRRHLGDR